MLKQFEDNALNHLNQDSSDRGRSATYDEPASKKYAYLILFSKNI